MRQLSKIVVIGAGLAAGLLFGLPGKKAQATPGEAMTVRAKSMVIGQITSQPIGHYEFCKVYNEECQPLGMAAAAPRVTDYGWEIVREVNEQVNLSVMPRTDLELFGREEVWTYPEIAGDCEDYVLLKRHMLIERGFSPSDLLITVVRKPDGEGHAVLTLRSTEGDYILDNLNDQVSSWTETPYRYLKRQSSANAGRWVTIEDGSELTVGSVR
ncbi:transglutaminase-like cysteine peptidase [Pseudohoeflea coraliihabitans]|uniref:Transglutaminase-like cysteine peptidase n=1 Tax=Pseudohoeflea coraliihabitans TaxID=2860393 RepID=A0ABS6WP03_9HYPH|nr:transglutaminase-like cysteine peptidase [Pseudohoeflea sp. DP4N28-3]MBW3097689.1 transglutaminase-like cysteine peptidase [Pseudohoeflea sp. DP4N28-3]